MLETGSVLGHYRVLRLLGRGGMGEVYAAEDLTLARQVAIKILPAGLSASAAERERFAREAKAIAALNHPGIVTLYSYEESDGVSFITMELVEGLPLSTKIPAHGMPLDELLRVGGEIAEAVAAAHERHIVHRDLKPANVLVTSVGRVKILDFGLAKLREPATPASELPTEQLTGEGRIVGTVAYMAPEQAEGKPVDNRTDVFALGVMLYELATGQRPFQGDTTVSVLSSVLKDTPRPASELNSSVPPALSRVLKTCLQKDPERRYQTVKDLRNELRTIREELDSGELSRPAAAAMPRRTSPWRWAIAGAIAIALGAAALALWHVWSRGSPAALTLQHARLTSASGEESAPCLSPDGKWLLYVSGASGNPDIYLQSVGGQTAINLTKDSPVPDLEPVFSPDGERIAFRSGRDGGGLFVMGRTGEAPRPIVAEGFDPSWSPDGTKLVYATASTGLPTSRTGLSGLRIVDLQTGAVTRLLEADGMHPSWSPNGRFIAYWGFAATETGRSPHRDLYVIPAEGGERWRLTNDPYIDWFPTWSPDGRFVYFASTRGGSMNLWRIPVDPDTGRAVGPPRAMTTPASYVSRPRLAATGDRIVYESRVTTSNIHRASFDLARAELRNVQPVTRGSLTFQFASPSPDNRWLVVGTGFLQQEDLYLLRADGSEQAPRQLTTDEFNDRWPHWSPDSQRIVFYSDRSGKYEIWTTTLGGQLTQLTNTDDHSPLFPRWSPDGTRLTFSDITRRHEVVLFDPRKPWNEQTPDVLPAPAGPGSLLQGRVVWSPDSRQLAGSVGGVVTIYQLATRQYHQVGEVRGQPYAWLPDGRLLVGPPAVLRLVDPTSARVSPVTMPAVGEASPSALELTRDGTGAYFALATSASDIWLVRLTGGD